VLADFAAYRDCQLQIDSWYRDPAHWARMSILNTARSGKFSSDRTVAEYAREIWRVDPVRMDRRMSAAWPVLT
jgi:starch phosphorylase